ncbi:hypothetical protein AB6806_27700 [Bosea sp. RCC_152_1]|uniref:hypothetical protein n=1 Tax=Bosea sp. RCC_152_1 TaxID=3239228 RepID=UPI003524BC0D
MAEKLSEKARAWLTLLRDHGPQNPKGRGNMPCSMRRKGLTEFEWRLTATGDVLSTARIDEMFLAGRSSEMTCGHDRLTEAGRAALEPRDER